MDLPSDYFIFLWLRLECLPFLLFEFVYPTLKLADQAAILVMASEGVLFELGLLDVDLGFLENLFAGGTSLSERKLKLEAVGKIFYSILVKCSLFKW